MYKKILVPLDGSDLAECSLNHFKNLFKDGSAEVVLLNAVVVELPWKEMNREEGRAAPAFDYRALVKASMDKATSYLAKVQSRLASEGIAVETAAVESGAASETITEYANKNGFDLIVIATHGYTGMKKMLLGSVATRVLHESHVPVLLIRPEACYV